MGDGGLHDGLMGDGGLRDDLDGWWRGVYFFTAVNC